MNNSKIALNTPVKTYKEAIKEMFEHTDENGILYIPCWSEYPLEGKEQYYRCLMNWTKKDASNTIKKMKSILKNIQKISKVADDLETKSETLNVSQELQSFFDTNLSELITEDDNIDLDRISDIEEQMNTIDSVKAIEENLNSKESGEISEEDIQFYNDCKDTTIDDEDLEEYDRYRIVLNKHAEERVGKGFFASEVIMRQRRIWKMLSMNAPKIIIRLETLYLAQAYAIHYYCKKLKLVDEVN